MAVYFPSMRSVTRDAQQRDALLVVAAAIMGREGIAAATLPRVAKEAGIRERTVRQLFGDEDGLHRAALAGQPSSEVAAFLEDAARQPGRMPPLAVLVEAGHRLYAALVDQPSTPDRRQAARLGDSGP